MASTSSDTLCFPAFRVREKAQGSCEHGPFMMAFKALTLEVAGWPDSALGCHPVKEVPVTQLFRGPMLEIQATFLSSAAAPPMLPVFTDTSGFLQSDVDTCSSTIIKHRASKTSSRLLGHVETLARRLAMGTTHH